MRASSIRLLICASLLSACSSPNPATSKSITTNASTTSPLASLGAAASSANAGEWWAHDQSSVLYLGWVVAADGSISGLGQYASVAADGLTVSTTPLDFTGALPGTSFTLNVGSRTWTGTMVDDQLQLTLATTTGALQRLVMNRGTIDDYNAGLSELRTNVSANVSVATQVAAGQAETKRISKLYSDLLVATGHLESVLATADAHQSLDTAVKLVATDADAARAVAADCNEVGYAIGTVEYDVNGVDYEISSLDVVLQDLRQRRDSVRSLSDQLSPIADNDDTAVAVATGHAAADKTDTLIATIEHRQTDAKVAAKSSYNAVAGLDDKC